MKMMSMMKEHKFNSRIQHKYWYLRLLKFLRFCFILLYLTFYNPNIYIIIHLLVTAAAAAVTSDDVKEENYIYVYVLYGYVRY